MAATQAFHQAVQNGDILSVHIMMKDSLLRDPSFKEFSEMESIAGNMSGLYEPHNGSYIRIDVGSCHRKCRSGLGNALPAYPGKSQIMRLYDAVKGLGSDVIDLSYTVHIHIDNCTAFVTVEVIVRTGVSIKVIQAVTYPYLLQFTKLCEQLKITVHGSERYIGIFVPDMHVYGIGRRVILAAHHEFFDRFSLSGILECHCLNSVLSTLTKQISNDY